MYLNGQVPLEDDTFKKILLQNVQYIKRVEHMLNHSGAAGSSDTMKSLTLNQLVEDKRD